MERTREQLKAELMAQMEEEIDRLLDWHERSEAPTLAEIEGAVLELRKRMGQRMTAKVIMEQAAVRPVPGPACPRCGREMHYKGMKGVWVHGRTGDMEVERGYYHCERCRRGFFPLDRQLKLKAKHWSEGVLKLAVWLSGIVDFETAEEILEQVGQIDISDSSIWRQVQQWGEVYRDIAEQERIRANVLPGRWGQPSQTRAPKGRMGVAVDGSMIHILGEGWKELKIGSVFEVEQRLTLDRETGEREGLAQAVNNSYVGYLGGPETFGQMIWAEAQRRGWEQASDTQALGDGAAWIWNLVADHFYDSHQTVDWYHGTEHLAALARLLKGDGTPAAQRWLNTQKAVLYEGHALRIALQLSALADERPELTADLQREAGYFHTHQRRMNYQQMREDGWAIGSGMVESAAKQFKARFTGPGMRWSRPGAERLIPVRAAIMSRRFDELWETAYNSPQN